MKGETFFKRGTGSWLNGLSMYDNIFVDVSLPYDIGDESPNRLSMDIKPNDGTSNVVNPGGSILSTRLGDDTGVVTVRSPHGLKVGVLTDLYWGGGSRLRMEVISISGLDVTVGGGSGDVLPAAGTTIDPFYWYPDAIRRTKDNLVTRHILGWDRSVSTFLMSSKTFMGDVTAEIGGTSGSVHYSIDISDEEIINLKGNWVTFMVPILNNGSTFIILLRIDDGIDVHDMNVAVQAFGRWDWVLMQAKINRDSSSVTFHIFPNGQNISVATPVIVPGLTTERSYYSGLPIVKDFSWDPASVADGASISSSFALIGARLGDTVNSSFSLDLQGLVLSSYVSADDTVTCTLTNNTGATVDLGAGTLTLNIHKN